MLQKGRKAQPRGRITSSQLEMRRLRITSSQLEMRRLSFIYIDLPYQMASKLYLLEWEIIEYDKWKILKLIDLPFKCRLPTTTKLQPSLFVSHLIFLSFYTSTYQQKRLYFFHHKIVFVHTTCQSMSFLEKKNKKKIYLLCVCARILMAGLEPALLIFLYWKFVNTFFPFEFCL